MNAERRKNLARDLLDRGVRRAQRRDVFLPEKGFRRGDFRATLFDPGVLAVGPARLTHLLQSHRIDGEAVELAAVRAQTLRQLAALEIAVGERIVRRAHAE